LVFEDAMIHVVDHLLRSTGATLRRSKGLDLVLLVASDGEVYAAWHGGERDSGRFTAGLKAVNPIRTNHTWRRAITLFRQAK
jgi:hypothetical protein